MNPILFTLFSISILFIFILLIRKLTKWKPCAICASVSLTWIGLLVLYWLGKFNEPVLIAVLMGQTALGVYYLLEKKVKEEWLIFRLPFLLTEIFIVFLLLGEVDDPLYVIGYLSAIWILFTIINICKSNKKINKIFKHLIACCKNW